MRNQLHKNFFYIQINIQLFLENKIYGIKLIFFTIQII